MKQLINNVAEITVQYRPFVNHNPNITSVIDAYDLLYDAFSQDTIALQEQFKVMYLNKSNTVIGIYNLSAGGIDSTVVDVRLVFAVGLKICATGMILSHNHPSGNLNPSHQDRLLTKRIREAAQLFQINLQDHIIIVPEKGKYYSFAEDTSELM
jgi:DNA repair protein RadC